jgi:hypothetical protein
MQAAETESTRQTTGVQIVSDMKQQLEAMHKLWPNNKMVAFMLAHGRDYTIDPATSFIGPRGEPQMCYANAAQRAFDDPALTYVEGKVSVFGVPVDHAWCVTKGGVVIETTLGPALKDKTFDRITGYYGVPFLTEYLRRAVLRNNVYGLLDIVTARKTLPKLVELGLDKGQQWLLASRLPPKSRYRRFGR